MHGPADPTDLRSFSISRREFIGGMGIGLIAFLAFEGRDGLRSFARAGRAGPSFRVLTAAEADLLEAWGDTLLSGASAAGLARYVDRELAGRPEESQLILRYLDVLPPFVRFYRDGLASLNAASAAVFGRPFLRLSGDEKHDLSVTAAVRNPPGWTVPPAPLFYYATLNDAADVVQGPLHGGAADGKGIAAPFRPRNDLP